MHTVHSLLAGGPVPNLNQGHDLKPGFIVSMTVTVIEFGVMGWIWSRNFGRKAKAAKKD